MFGMDQKGNHVYIITASVLHISCLLCNKVRVSNEVIYQ